MTTRFVKFLDLSSQHAAIRSALDTAIDDVLTHSSFIGGAWVQQFEQSWAEYTGAKHCIGVANGTDALEIILRAIGAQLHRAVVPALTAPPTAEAVVCAGAQPVFCDCNPDFLISVSSVAQTPTSRLKAIIPVHLYGNACDMEVLQRIATDLDAVIIEDCCQAHGTRHNNRHVGTFGIAGAFSFYPSKNLGAFGDAGAIITNDDDIAAFCRIYANGGRASKNLHTVVGRNSRLDALQAAVLCVKLRYLDSWLTHRREVAQMYAHHLPAISAIYKPPVSPNATHSYHIYAIQVLRRSELRAHLLQHGIETGVHYPLTVPDQPAYQRYAAPTQPYACTLADTTLSLPMGPHVTEEDVKYVARCIEGFYDV